MIETWNYQQLVGWNFFHLQDQLSKIPQILDLLTHLTFISVLSCPSVPLASLVRDVPFLPILQFLDTLCSFVSEILYFWTYFVQQYIQNKNEIDCTIQVFDMGLTPAEDGQGGHQAENAAPPCGKVTYRPLWYIIKTFPKLWLWLWRMSRVMKYFLYMASFRKTHIWKVVCSNRHCSFISQN